MPNGATGSTSWPRSQRGTGVSPVKDPFGVQALACPDQCSVKAELRTCARCIFMRVGCAPAHVRLWFHFVQSVQPEILVRLRTILTGSCPRAPQKASLCTLSLRGE